MYWPIIPTQENSRQTLELRQIVESGVNIWAFDYPSYYKGDEKKAFEQKVIDHFWTRQIGAETVGRFLFYFRRTMREIMPVYLQRYKSVEMMNDPSINPLDNYFMIEEYEQSTEGQSKTEGSTDAKTTGTGSASSSSANTDKKTRAHSDTPQGQIFFPIFTEGVSPTMNLDYASDITQEYNLANSTDQSSANETSTSEGSSSDQTETSGKQSHKLTRRGNIGVTTYAQMLEGYRASFIDVDMEIINDLESCFLEVF